MFNAPIIDFAISLIFIYLLFSLLTSWIIEAYSRWLNWKGKFLRKMIYRLLGGDEGANWAARLYNHPIIESLSVKYSRLTSYIPDDTFAEVVTDLIVEEGRDYSIRYDKTKKEYAFNETKGTYQDDLAKGLKKMNESDLKRTFNMFFDQAKENDIQFKEALKNWYREYQQRMNHTYGRRIKVPLIILGFSIALVFNIDFFHISSRLWTDSNLRENIVLAASEFEQKHGDPDSLNLSLEFFKKYKNSLALPIGWAEELKPKDRKVYYKKHFFQRAGMIFTSNSTEAPIWWHLIVKIIGFVLSGFVVSFGAPFWFDLLRKAISLKKSVKPATESKS